MKKADYKDAGEILIDHVREVSTVIVNIEELYGRVLAEDIIATEDVPAYARSPYDGYAFRSVDTEGASEERPVVLDIIESIRVNQVPFNIISAGTAIRLVTGSPLPGGADAVCKFEETEFNDKIVKIRRKYEPGENIICAGEDIERGTLLAKRGSVIDAGLIGAMASLGIRQAEVYRRVIAGIISTGDEVIDLGEPLKPGMIRNSNRYTISAALKSIGIDTVYLGHAGDDKDEIKKLIMLGEGGCDIIVSTGGVSAGEYDLVPEAMEMAGFELLVRGVNIKPGMACAYGFKDGMLMLALSGNPASSLTNLQCVCYPALRKLTGIAEYGHELIKMKIGNDCIKRSRGVRFIRGNIGIEDGTAVLRASGEQGNIVISSAIGCNAYGIISIDEGAIKAGTMIDGFFVL